MNRYEKIRWVLFLVQIVLFIALSLIYLLLDWTLYFCGTAEILLIIVPLFTALLQSNISKDGLPNAGLFASWTIFNFIADGLAYGVIVFVISTFVAH